MNKNIDKYNRQTKASVKHWLYTTLLHLFSHHEANTITCKNRSEELIATYSGFVTAMRFRANFASFFLLHFTLYTTTEGYITSRTLPTEYEVINPYKYDYIIESSPCAANVELLIVIHTSVQVSRPR